MRHFKIKTDLTARTANNESEHTEKKKKNKIRTERNLSLSVALCVSARGCKEVTSDSVLLLPLLPPPSDPVQTWEMNSIRVK